MPQYWHRIALRVTSECAQMPPKAKAAGKGRAPAKRKLAEEFPPGEVLTDTVKKAWKLGSPIGQGGFGLIYLGSFMTNVNKLHYNVLQFLLCLCVLKWEDE